MYGVMKPITKFQNQLDANNKSALTTAMQYQAACVDRRTSRESDALRANGKRKDLTDQRWVEQVRRSDDIDDIDDMVYELSMSLLYRLY